MKPKILCVDDEANQRRLMANYLRKQGYQVFESGGGEEALVFLEQEPCDLILSDMKMGSLSGKDLLRELRAAHQQIPFILITAFSNIDDAVEMIKMGASDYISKPVNLSELLMKIERLFAQDQLKRENELLRNEVFQANTGHQILTQNSQMLSLLDMVARVAKTDVPLLILGESGTGKEMVARSLHEFSSRKKGAFIPVNCASLNPGVLESELFGHEKGAFTGAAQAKVGRVEMAQNGTLFLDEIGDIPLDIQVKLLRVLQEQEIERVGGNRRIPVNFRLVSATHKDLESAIKNEAFREDFFYRINVVSAKIPPLRERPEDITLLTTHFTHLFANKFQIPLKGIAPEAMQQMRAYDFPGNIRELMNIVQRSLVLSGDGWIQRFDCPCEESLKKEGTKNQNWLKSIPNLELPAALDQVEKELIQRALNQFKGVQTKAAEHLGITERNLRYKLSK